MTCAAGAKRESVELQSKVGIEAAKNFPIATAFRRRKHTYKNMIDSVEPITAAAPVAPPKRKRTRGPLNQGHLVKLTKAEGIGEAAENTDYAAALGEREISADFVTEFLSDTDDARTKA